MGAFTRIPADTFSQIQTDAGILLYKFNIDKPGEVSDEDIICPTTGGITAAAKPTYSDMGEDVDNCPANLLELKHLDSWDCRLECTSLGTTPKSIRLALGAADVDGENPTHIIPRVNLKVSDASDVWWVGDRADGGMVAVCLKRALSTAGFSLQTTKAGKGQTSITLTGHVSVATQDEVPIEFYSMPPAAGGVMEQTHTLDELGKKPISELIDKDTYIKWRGTNGIVDGKLKKITSWNEFSSSAEENTGYFFPFRLSDDYEGKPITVKGKHEKTEADLDWVLFVTKDGNEPTSFTFSVDDENGEKKEIAKLDFSEAVFDGAED